MPKRSSVALTIVIVMFTTAARGSPNDKPAPGPTTRPYRPLGIVLMDLNDYDDAAAQIRGFGGNLVVSEVADNSRAQRMGLRQGDVIRRVNGKDMATVPDVSRAVRVADTLTIDVLRQGKSTTLDERSPAEKK